MFVTLKISAAGHLPKEAGTSFFNEEKNARRIARALMTFARDVHVCDCVFVLFLTLGILDSVKWCSDGSNV